MIMSSNCNVWSQGDNVQSGSSIRWQFFHRDRGNFLHAKHGGMASDGYDLDHGLELLGLIKVTIR